MTSPLSESERILLEALVQLEDEPTRRRFLDFLASKDPSLSQRLEVLVSSYLASTPVFGTTEFPKEKSQVERTRGLPGPRPAVGAQVGAYELQEFLGQGSSSDVFRAIQREPFQRTVALKIARGESYPPSPEVAYPLEQDILALLNHPLIAQVYDAGTTPEGLRYLAMEWVEGTPLTRFAEEQSLTLRQRVALLVQICSALLYAHQKGIIHGDLKPAHLLITTLTDGTWSPKIIDFGLARLTATPSTPSHFVTGTLAYLSPEQVLYPHVPADSRRDLYALGVILFELIVGRPPSSFHAFRRTSPNCGYA